MVPDWPKLAWVAHLTRSPRTVEVLHGPCVEAGRHWCVEAAWAGDFAEGDFDRTDLIAGTGVRARKDGVVLVSSGTAVDRLWHTHDAGRWTVSNSLPALLAVSPVRLRQDHLRYAEDIETIDEGGGLSRYVRRLPSEGGPLEVVYFHNLLFDGHRLREIEKPHSAPAFETYQDYASFLRSTAERLGDNARSADRSHRVVLVTTLSSGYDSTATAVVARHAGCRRAVTIPNSTSLWRGSDSGQRIARYLDLTCTSHRHTPRAYHLEETVWAAIGRPRGLNYTVLRFPEPLCLLFTGNYGDKIWDLSYADVSEPTGDLSGLCMCEYRLIQGLFHCMPAWWAVRRSQRVQQINHSSSMRPWRVGGDYDRPIARRIIEEAGVPRGAFARRKMNTSSEAEFWWPYARRSQARFRQYLHHRNLAAPGPLSVRLIRCAARLENLFHGNFGRRLGLRKRFRPWRKLTGSRLVFQWANEELTRMYREGLGQASSDRENACR
jgi:hypothetical protein